MQVQVLRHGGAARQQRLLGRCGIAALALHHRQPQPRRRAAGPAVDGLPVQRLGAGQRRVVVRGRAHLGPAQRLVRRGHRAPVAAHAAQPPRHHQQHGRQPRRPGAPLPRARRAVGQQARDGEPRQQRQRRHQRQPVARDDEEHALHRHQRQQHQRPPARRRPPPGGRQARQPQDGDERVRRDQRAQRRRRARPAVEGRQLVDLPALQVQAHLLEPQARGARGVLPDRGQRGIGPQAVGLREADGRKVEALGQERAAGRVQQPRAGHHGHVESVRLGPVADVEVHAAVQRRPHQAARGPGVARHRRRQHQRRAHDDDGDRQQPVHQAWPRRAGVVVPRADGPGDRRHPQRQQRQRRAAQHRRQAGDHAQQRRPQQEPPRGRGRTAPRRERQEGRHQEGQRDVEQDGDRIDRGRPVQREQRGGQPRRHRAAPADGRQRREVAAGQRAQQRDDAQPAAELQQADAAQLRGRVDARRRVGRRAAAQRDQLRVERGHVGGLGRVGLRRGAVEVVDLVEDGHAPEDRALGLRQEDGPERDQQQAGDDHAREAGAGGAAARAHTLNLISMMSPSWTT